jgi:hypothetical protein
MSEESVRIMMMVISILFYFILVQPVDFVPRLGVGEGTVSSIDDDGAIFELGMGNEIGYEIWGGMGWDGTRRRQEKRRDERSRFWLFYGCRPGGGGGVVLRWGGLCYARGGCGDGDGVIT